MGIFEVGCYGGELGGRPSFASASVLYDNGAINGGINAWNISNGYAVENSFTLSSASTVTGVLFGLWSNPGDVISTVDLGISTTQGSFADNGTVPVTQGAFFGMDGFGYGYDIYTYSISIGPDSLAAGTYYLTLQNAAVTNSDSVFWDENDGPSSAMQTSTGVIGSEAFAVLDDRSCAGTCNLGDDGARLRRSWPVRLSPRESARLGRRNSLSPTSNRKGRRTRVV